MKIYVNMKVTWKFYLFENLKLAFKKPDRSGLALFLSLPKPLIPQIKESETYWMVIAQSNMNDSMNRLKYVGTMNEKKQFRSKTTMV